MQNEKQFSPKDEYIPYGPEWEKEMMKLPKSMLIKMFKSKCLELQNITHEQEKAL